MLGQRDERGPALRGVGAGADDERRRLARRRAARRARRSPRAPRRLRAAGGRGRAPRAPRARREPVVHRHDDERGAASADRRVVGADERAGDVLRADGLLDRTGYSPARPSRRPARNGSWARWRRSCWPTMTTSGARFTRAVASAETALPSPAVVCSRAKAGSPRPIAKPVAMPTTEPSCSASTKRRSSGRPVRNETSVEPGLEKIVVSPSPRRTSKVASRTVGAAVPPLPLAATSGAVPARSPAILRHSNPVR